MKKYFLLCFCCFYQFLVYSSENLNMSYEFVNQEITEIVYAISLGQNIPIVCDDTVTGKASFRFSGDNFEKAFNSFLNSARLYVNKEDEVWVVSKIKIEHLDNGFIHLDAYDVYPSIVFEKISLTSLTPVIHDFLPQTKISIHLSNVDIFDAAKLIMQSFNEYNVINEKTYVLIKREEEKHFEEYEENNLEVVKYQNGYYIKGKKFNLDSLFEKLFEVEKKEYISFIEESKTVDNISLVAKTFDQILNLICLKASCTYIIEKDIYYLIEDKSKKEELIFKNYSWYKSYLKYQNSNDVINLIQKRFSGIKVILINDNFFIFFTTKNKSNEIFNFINLIDVNQKAFHYELKFIKTSDLYKNLPPYVEKSSIIDSGNERDIFFTGTENEFNQLKNYFSIIDKPIPSIKYDVLIIQFLDSKDSSWSNSFTIKSADNKSFSTVNGFLAPALDLKFDVVSTLGLNFAIELQNAIQKNTAKIFADTTLHGISGKNIKFQNTNTYRYRDLNIDIETGTPLYTGVTREVVAGLILDITGWVSGDGMITTDVTATVSRQEGNNSQSTNPPITSEKIITTQVSSRSGEAVILSGLKQTDNSIQKKENPILSKIPILRHLFKSTNRTQENTEVVIYLVPHLQMKKQKKLSDNEKIQKLFNQFIKKENIDE